MERPLPYKILLPNLVQPHILPPALPWNHPRNVESLISSPEINERDRCSTRCVFLQAMPDILIDDQLVFALHLPNHQILVQSIGAGEQQQSSTFDGEETH